MKHWAKMGQIYTAIEKLGISYSFLLFGQFTWYKIYFQEKCQNLTTSTFHWEKNINYQYSGLFLDIKKEFLTLPVPTPDEVRKLT